MICTGKRTRPLLWGAVLAAAALAPAHAGTAPPPATCPTRTLDLDIAQLRGISGVRDVVMEDGSPTATVLFANGDVLRIAQTGCVKPVLVARLWVTGQDGVSDEVWKQRASLVSRLALKPDRAAQVAASLETTGVDQRINGGPKIERPLPNGAGYSMTVMRSTQDSLGLFLSMVYLNL
jgi:hypothetical protein